MVSNRVIVRGIVAVVAGIFLLGVSVARAAFADGVAPADAAALPVLVSCADRHLSFDGRFDAADPTKRRCAWPATAVSLCCKASAVNVSLSDSGTGDRFAVTIDGQVQPVLAAQLGSHLYRVLDSPTVGTHTITLVKRTEAFCGTAEFDGFQLSAGGALRRLKKMAHRIEVIGDSISCGYGDEGTDRSQHFSVETENASLAYGAVAADALNSAYSCMAWSGKCMWPKNTIPELYDRTIPTEDTSTWDFRSQIPNVVVINLGTNDFRDGAPDRAGWTAAYEQFIARVRMHYPKARIYCSTSPMMGDPDFSTEKSYLTQIVQFENGAGDSNVTVLLIPTQDGSTGYGADWHPNVKEQAIVGQILASAVRSDLHW